MSRKNVPTQKPKGDTETRRPGPQAQATVLVRALLHWFGGNARDLPWRPTRDPYAIWVSEIMLQQTQVKTVVPYWERWMQALPTIGALASAEPETIHKLWEGLGYYTRVRNLQKAAREIVAKHQGEFPRDHAAILDLPGIGRYTAGAISSIAFNEPWPILDGNVIRVLTRLFGLKENPHEKTANEKLWRLAGQLVTTAAESTPPIISPTISSTQHVPRNPFSPACSQLNQSLMELGALICTPKQPKCPACPVRKNCIAHRTGRTGELPNLGPRARASTRHFAAFVIGHRGRFMVRQRPAGVVNAHLWEFPNFELTNGHADLKDLARQTLGLNTTALQKLRTIKHSITRYRITLDAFRASLEPTSSGSGEAATSRTRKSGAVDIKSTTGNFQWFPLKELNLLAFSSAHRKILDCLGDGLASTRKRGERKPHARTQ